MDDHSEKARLGSGDDGWEDPPVPIPNTVVKLSRVESTWLEAAREDRLLPVGNRTAENIRSAVFCVRQFLYA